MEAAVARAPEDGGESTDWAFLVAVLLVPAGLALIAAGILLHQSAFLHGTGIEPRSPSTAYNAWSGFLSDLGEYTIAVALSAHLYQSLRRHNCREHGCWWIGLHTYIDGHGQPHPACRRHHPTHPARSGRHFRFAELHAHKLAAAEMQTR